MSYIYPTNPHFDPLIVPSRADKDVDVKEAMAHDPSLFQDDDGTYYAFATDTFGSSGYPIRKSVDLIHWTFVGCAFDLKDSKETYAKIEAYDKFSGLQPAFNWCVTYPEEAGEQICTKPTGEMGFWAPYVTKGADGKYWLYFCLTGYFGGSRSCIGLAKSDRVTGPYFFDDLIVCSQAGWRSPNAIDPQIVYDENGDMYMSYGSYGLGIFILALDRATGKRKDGLTRADFDKNKATFREYFGVNIAGGSLEGSVIKYHKDIPVIENGRWTKKSYYFLMCSYGSLSSVYNMRCGRSENIMGPYVDVNGLPLVCSTDIGSGNKLMGSYRWEGSKFDYFCPGHNDMMITKDGKNVISYHCRTHALPTPPDIPKKFRKSFVPHFLFVNQYTFNSDGWLVMCPNRYAGENLDQDITKEEFLEKSGGRFNMIIFRQDAGTNNIVKSVKVRLHKNGKISGRANGEWKIYDGRYIRLYIDCREYLGRVMPAWISENGAAGVCVSAMGVQSGMALYLNQAAPSAKEND